MALERTPKLEPSKSQVDVYVGLIEQLLRCDPLSVASKHLRKDIIVMKQRYHSEGLSFLTKTLPKLGKALDHGLASNHFSVPREFKRSHENSSIPAFMQEYFKRLFDANGTLLDTADPAAVIHLRQVLFFVYKLEVPFTDEQNQRVLDDFVQTDETLGLDLDKDSREILEVSSFITEDVFHEFDIHDITPKHGPGAVATGERLEEKWEFSRLYNNIHQVYPYYDYFIAGGASELIDRLDWYKNLTRLDQGRAKVVLVPKDSRGPRLISCEPLEYQWVQQGLGRKLVNHLESNRITRGQINFTNQSINRQLALQSSVFSERKENFLDVTKRAFNFLSGAFATIDLKDASDRVSLELVEKVFKRTPSLLRALQACRTSSTILPDGRIVEFRKFAPMGSALCFPVESYVFWVLLVAAISRHFRVRQSIVAKLIYVYGDDIIIPTELAEFSIQQLERFALKVNHSKCCIYGPFRESCGMDAFKGVPVTPIRLKTLWSGRKSDGSAYVSYIACANLLAAKGYLRCSDFIWDLVEKTYGKLPLGTSRASYPCKIVNDPEVAEEYNSRAFRSRYSRSYQLTEYRLLNTYPKRIKSKLDSWPRLLRDLVSPSFEDPSIVVKPRSTVINRGWTATH
jgi:hypothetical protein